MVIPHYPTKKKKVNGGIPGQAKKGMSKANRLKKKARCTFLRTLCSKENQRNVRGTRGGTRERERKEKH